MEIPDESKATQSPPYLKRKLETIWVPDRFVAAILKKTLEVLP